ncbi:receptor-interacting serine/threonine-protein kinase 3-like [Sander lucioperca]|uniref:receptor-interacting serine/threonine-protein kinase 3-like n=1 Tax=Sander lucioperca TaxID=283035 RepID=UPI0016535755|nr:receptor-interacting serine/threonine-protein kinase 3-like [Sander lucioperca]
MPPEAFGLRYEPKRASDICSYGILLWSILTGKQPYKDAHHAIVELRVPQGQRPPIDNIKGDAAGLTELTELMQRCWDNIPKERPRAFECTTKTEELYQMHKHAIFDTIHEVLKKLDQKEKEDKEILTAQASGLYLHITIAWFQTF